MTANTTRHFRASVHIPGPAFAAQQRTRSRAAARAAASTIFTDLLAGAGIAIAFVCVALCMAA